MSKERKSSDEKISNKSKNDSLFLLEVLIEKVTHAKAPCTDRGFRTCVTVDCSSVPTIEVYDDESTCAPKGSNPFTTVFNAGKSCLFSLKEDEIKSAMNKFLLKVNVHKTLPCSCIPAKIFMGKATIDMTKEFVQARRMYLEDSSVVSHQALKDCFYLSGPENAECGTIDMFLRISCFGSLIMTKFQGASGGLNLGGGNDIVDRACYPGREFQTPQDPCACGLCLKAKMEGRSFGSCPMHPGTAQGAVCSSSDNPYTTMPCQDPEDPCYCTGPKPPPQVAMACRSTDPYCLHIPKGRSKEYEEIGTTVNGNELKIKVPAHAAVIKKISQTHCYIQQPPAKGKAGGPCEPPCGKNQISLALPCEATCCKGARPTDTQFTCTSEICSQTTKHADKLSARGDNKVKGQKIIEPVNKDVFVLKVARTANEGEQKSRLELELTAPKAGDKPYTGYTANQRIQAAMDCSCCCRKLVRMKPSTKLSY